MRKRKELYIVSEKYFSLSDGCIFEPKPHHILHFQARVAAIVKTMYSDHVYVVECVNIPRHVADDPEFDVNYFVSKNIPYKYI